MNTNITYFASSADSHCCGLLDQITDTYLKEPQKDELDKPLKALLHLSHWLASTEEVKNNLVPVIENGRLCLFDSESTELQPEKIMAFANGIFFPSQLDQIKTDPCMKIQWYFADLSRELDEFNPFCTWLMVDDNSFLPFDIATKCKELKETKPSQLDALTQNDTIVFTSFEILDDIWKVKLPPVHTCIDRDSVRVEWQRLKEMMEESTEESLQESPVVPRLKLEEIFFPLSPRINSLRQENSDYFAPITPRAPGPSGRRRGLTPRPLDLNDLDDLLIPVDSDYSDD